MVIIIVAAIAGAAWAAIPAILKVTRGVNEVISTIMMNGLAIGLSAYLIRRDVFGELRGNNIRTAGDPGERLDARHLVRWRRHDVRLRLRGHRRSASATGS